MSYERVSNLAITTLVKFINLQDIVATNVSSRAGITSCIHYDLGIEISKEIRMALPFTTLKLNNGVEMPQFGLGTWVGNLYNDRLNTLFCFFLIIIITSPYY